MAQTITCDTCHKTVYITDLQNGADFDKKYLSCGHIQKIHNKASRKTSAVSKHLPAILSISCITIINIVLINNKINLHLMRISEEVKIKINEKG